MKTAIAFPSTREIYGLNNVSNLVPRPLVNEAVFVHRRFR